LGLLGLGGVRFDQNALDGRWEWLPERILDCC